MRWYNGLVGGANDAIVNDACGRQRCHFCLFSKISFDATCRLVSNGVLQVQSFVFVLFSFYAGMHFSLLEVSLAQGIWCRMVDMRSESGFTPLHFAVSASNATAGQLSVSFFECKGCQQFDH